MSLALISAILAISVIASIRADRPAISPRRGAGGRDAGHASEAEQLKTGGRARRATPTLTKRSRQRHLRSEEQLPDETRRRQPEPGA